MIGLFVLCMLSVGIHAQTGFIKPGKTYVNTSGDTIYYLPQSKLIEYKILQTNYDYSLQKIGKYEKLVANYKERIFWADSTSRLRKIEADIWRTKLLSNDNLFEAERKVTIQLNQDKQDLKRSRIYYFLAGIVATSITIVAVK